MEDSTTPTELKKRFGDIFSEQSVKDNVLTYWLPLEKVKEVLFFLKAEISKPYLLLFDLTAIDERTRKRDPDYPSTQFTLVYHLLSFDRNSFIRLKVAL